MDTQHFAIKYWVDIDLLAFRRIGTHDNESDIMTKNMGRILFYSHVYCLIGKMILEYAKKHTDLQL